MLLRAVMEFMACRWPGAAPSSLQTNDTQSWSPALWVCPPSSLVLLLSRQSTAVCSQPSSCAAPATVQILVRRACVLLLQP